MEKWFNALPPEAHAAIGGVLGVIVGAVLVLTAWTIWGRRS